MKVLELFKELPMEKDILSRVEKEILDLLKKKGKDYLTGTQIKNGISAASLKQLGLQKKSATIADVVNKLTPCLGERLQVYKAAKLYIGYKRSPEEILLNKLKQKPDLSIGQLGKDLPMMKKSYIATLNALIESGTLICTFNENYIGFPKISDKIQRPLESGEVSVDDRTAFKEAYDQVGKGRSFVRIHRIREYLNWPRDRFDRVLTDLMANYAVELHGGDPSALTETEVRNSFMDENGMLYTALSWRGET